MRASGCDGKIVSLYQVICFRLFVDPMRRVFGHLIGLTVTQRFKAFLLNLDVNRTGSYIAPVFENDFPFRMAELRFDGYTKADAFGSYERRTGERWTWVLYAGVENFLNRKYYENGFLAPGAVGRGGIKLKF